MTTVSRNVNSYIGQGQYLKLCFCAIIYNIVDNNTLLLVKSAIKKHLDTEKYKAFIFGSRVSENHRKFSDLDIGIMGSGKVPSDTILKIQEEISNSDIPYLTDVVDFATVTKDFRDKTLSNSIPL